MGGHGIIRNGFGCLLNWSNFPLDFEFGACNLSYIKGKLGFPCKKFDLRLPVLTISGGSAIQPSCTNHSPEENHRDHLSHFKPALRTALTTRSLSAWFLYGTTFEKNSTENLGFIRRTSPASARASFSRPAKL